jgi:hypothetical protein
VPNNNGNSGELPRIPPDLGFGVLQIVLNLDDGNIQVLASNPKTLQLCHQQELVGLISVMAFNLYREELKRRSKQVIIT